MKTRSEYTQRRLAITLAAYESTSDEAERVMLRESIFDLQRRIRIEKRSKK